MTYKYTQNYPTERKDYPSKKSAVKTPDAGYHPTEGDPEDGGKLSPADAERISSDDFPGAEDEEDDGKKAA